jgi:choloylglycine hydrolase
MRRAARFLLALSLTLWTAATGPVLDACTTLCLRSDGRIVFGKNYDWMVADGVLLVNKRGVARASDGPPAASAAWVSKYGSVTFNQYGRDFPSGGMNEAGLVVELMWAEGSRYPRPDARPAVGCLEWIQYQLDTARTVADVVGGDARIRISGDVPLHYLVADRDGNVATIEFVGGKLVAHAGSGLPIPVLANDLYADSLRFVETARSLPPGPASRARFARAADRVRTYRPPDDPVAYVFDTLTNVSQESTQWSIVYEIDRGLVHFRTRGNPRVRTLSLAALDFGCATPVLALDLGSGEGDVRPLLAPYSRAQNLRLIRSTFGQTEFLKSVPAAELERIAARPDETRCREQDGAGAP